MVLGYLISPVVQIVDNHGKPIVGAKIYVYKAGTTNTVNTYRDFSNHYNTTPVLTDTLGNCTIIASDDMIYDIVVKDNRNNLLMSKDNLTVSSGVNPDINLRFNQGYGIIIRKNGNTVTISIDTDVIATKDDLAAKQDKLTAGDNIEITQDNTVNVVNRKTVYTQWPLKVDRGSSMVKLYLDQDFVDNNDTEIVPGVDLNSYTDELGRQVIGVDTNGVSSGTYNFVAGYNTSANGNHNFVAGAGCTANGNRNAVFGYDNAAHGYSNFVVGANNDVSGSCNLVCGQNNEAEGTANTVFGVGNSITDDTYNCNTIIGQYATQGDYYFAVGNGSQATRSNVFEVRKNGDIYYKYNNEMLQLAPSYDTDPLVHGIDNTAKNTHNPTTNAYDEIYGHKNYLDGYQNGIFGLNNTVDGTNIYVLGQNNTMSSSLDGTPVSICIGNSNTMNECYGTFLIGNNLSGDSESYNRIKIGFGNRYLEINDDGTFYKVVDGVKTAI